MSLRAQRWWALIIGLPAIAALMLMARSPGFWDALRIAWWIFLICFSIVMIVRALISAVRRVGGKRPEPRGFEIVPPRERSATPTEAPHR